jgi:hypothetical protein
MTTYIPQAIDWFLSQAGLLQLLLGLALFATIVVVTLFVEGVLSTVSWMARVIEAPLRYAERDSTSADFPLWLNTTSAFSFTASAYFAALFVVLGLSIDEFDQSIGRIPEIIMISIGIICASVSWARTKAEFAARAIFFSIPAFAILYLILYQNLVSLFVVGIVLICLASWELLQQEFGEEPFLSRITQVVGVISFFPFALLTLVHYLSPNLATALNEQSILVAIFRTRMSIAITVAAIVVLHIGIEAFRYFRFQYLELWPFPSAIPSFFIRTRRSEPRLCFG